MAESAFSLGPLWTAGSTAQGKTAVLAWVRDVFLRQTNDVSGFLFEWLARPERKVTDSSGHLVEVRFLLLRVRLGHKDYVLRFDERDVEVWQDQPELKSKYHSAVVRVIEQAPGSGAGGGPSR